MEIGLDEEDEEAMMEALRQPVKRKGKGAKGGKDGKQRGPVAVDIAEILGKGRTCNDGRKPLKGFLLCKDEARYGKHYPPPEVPADFAPFHRFNDMLPPPTDWAKELQDRPASLADCTKDQLLALAMGKRPPAPDQRPPARPQLTANQRAEMLGETPVVPVGAPGAAGGPVVTAGAMVAAAG
eukprot:1116905-Rhodomonas_salina.1